jgi:hypothetical protein
MEDEDEADELDARIAGMLSRLEALLARSSALSSAHRAVLEEAERLLRDIELARLARRE